MKSKKRIVAAGLLVLTMVVLLSGCMAHNDFMRDEPAGFFSGVWHGWIAPLGLIVGLFNKTVTIYEVQNVGWWYDFGFYMAIISGFGGLSLSRKKKNKDH